MELEEHYGHLLGIKSPWEITSIDLNMEDYRVDIVIEYGDDQGPCPECGAICPKHDNRKRHSWRHLDAAGDHPEMHRIYTCLRMKNLEINYAVGGGGGTPTQELLIWNDNAQNGQRQQGTLELF